MLREKRQLANSKCSICARLDKLLFDLRGLNDKDSVENRAFLWQATTEHESNHLNDRAEMDNAGFLALASSRSMWCVMCDAATQRNFNLPKFKHRSPKNFSGFPLWEFTLMGTYAFGYGFTPYLCHNSLKHGSNLAWTALYQTLCDMRDHHGFWPLVLHLQLDNCSSDNKNFVTFAMAAWLVASGKVKQVRIFFLGVGHTHVIIDQIFGVVTTGTKREELTIPNDLIMNINATLKKNSVYKSKPTVWLRSLFDFHAWAAAKSGLHAKNSVTTYNSSVQLTDSQGPFTGMYDFLISQSPNYCGASMVYRESIKFEYRGDENGGVEVIRNFPREPPRLAPFKSKASWYLHGAKSFEQMLSSAKSHLRSVVSDQDRSIFDHSWKHTLDNVPEVLELLHPRFKLNFRHFTLALPRILDRGVPDVAPTLNANLDDYTEWKRRVLGMRETPFEYDPVISNQQSKAAQEALRQEYEIATRGFQGPCVNATSLVFVGNFILAERPAVAGENNRGVSLFKVTDLGAFQSPNSLLLECKSVRFQQTVNPDCCGMFGNFQALTAKKEPSHIIRRAQIVVYNCGLFTSKFKVKDAKGKVRTISKHYLTVNTLRLLSQARPVEYPMPDLLPATHVGVSTQPIADRGKKARKKPVAKKRKRARAKESSSEDSPSESSGDSYEDSSGEDPDQEVFHDSGDEADVRSCTEDDLSDAEGSQGSEEGEISIPIPIPLADSDVPCVTAPLSNFKKGDIIWTNQVGADDCLDYEHPIVPAYVESVDGEDPMHIYVRWFMVPKKLPIFKRDFTEKNKRSYTPKFMVFPKWLQHKNLKAHLKKSEKNLTDKDYWDNWKIESLPKADILDISFPWVVTKTPIHKVDLIKLSSTFYVDVLIPATESSN